MFNGYEDEYQNVFWDNYIQFESKYKNVFNISEECELKGQIIKPKNFANGFASFNNNTLNFYNDFFDILNSPKIVIQLYLCSKTEQVIKAFLQNINFDNRVEFNRESFEYIIIKFMFNYRNKSLLEKMMDVHSKSDIDKCLYSLKKMMQLVIKFSKKSKLKETESNALKEIIYILSEHTYVGKCKDSRLEFQYEPIFIGLNKLLQERNIDEQAVNLFIDKEYNTYNAALKCGKYSSCKEEDSGDCIGVRISDILSHFIGVLTRQLDIELRINDIQMYDDLEKIDYSTKKLLKPSWFDVSKSQFLLWKKVCNVFLDYQNYEWTGYDGTYFDYPALVFSFIRYVNLYETYEEFRSVCLNQHIEIFNTYCCSKMEELFERAGTHAALDKYKSNI